MPPAWAIVSRPPPPPPTTCAAVLTIAPAFTPRSTAAGVAEAIRLTRPSPADAEDDDGGLAELRRAGGRRGPGSAFGSGTVDLLDEHAHAVDVDRLLGVSTLGGGGAARLELLLEPRGAP